jgi:hypothetical protein
LRSVRRWNFWCLWNNNSVNCLCVCNTSSPDQIIVLLCFFFYLI